MLHKSAKKIAKEIEVTRPSLLKGKASTQIKKPQSLFRNDDLATAKQHVEVGVLLYDEIRRIFFDF